MKVSLAVLTSILVLLLSGGVALAQEEPESGEYNFERVNDIATDLTCPTCAGVSLADCKTQTCGQWKDQVNDLVNDGYTDQEVLDYFSTRYGIQVLQSPPKSGFTLMLWVLPVMAVLIGTLWLGYTVRLWANRQPAPAPVRTESTLSDDDLRLIEKDLEQ